MTNSQPKPTILFAIASVFFIAGNLLVDCVYIAQTCTDASSLMGAIIMVPLCSFLAIQQYRGTFRCAPIAANANGMLCYIFGGVVIIGLMSLLWASIEADRFVVAIPGLSLLAAVSMFCLGFGRMNSLWAKRLWSYEGLATLKSKRSRFSLGELMLVVGIIATMTGITLHLVGVPF